MNKNLPLAIAPWSSDHFNLEGAIDFTIDTKNTSLPNFTEFDREMQCDLPIQSEEVQPFEDEISLEEIPEYISACAPAIEIIDSRFANFKFSLEDVIADNCSSSSFVIGAWQPLPEILTNRTVALLFDKEIVSDEAH